MYRKIENYYIDHKKGIFYTENSYHDSVDYHYVVDFDKPDVDKQFKQFLEHKERDGEYAAMQKLKQQFRGLRELLS